MSALWEAPDLPTPPAPPRRTLDSRCLCGFEALVGRTVTAIIPLYFPSGALIVCGDVYLAVRAETGYENTAEINHAPAHITELREMGFATQADLAAYDTMQRENNLARERLEYERLKEKFK